MIMSTRRTSREGIDHQHTIDDSGGHIVRGKSSTLDSEVNDLAALRVSTDGNTRARALLLSHLHERSHDWATHGPHQEVALP